jgi:hypothetical protein
MLGLIARLLRFGGAPRAGKAREAGAQSSAEAGPPDAALTEGDEQAFRAAVERGMRRGFLRRSATRK